MSRLLISNNKVINISTLIDKFIGTGYKINYQITDNCFKVEYHGEVLFLHMTNCMAYLLNTGICMVYI